MLHPQYFMEKEKQERLIAKKNRKSDFYNGIFDRYEDPVLTREHAPVEWRYDLDYETNPYFMERLGINAVMNSGAIELDGKFYLVARVEGSDRKSFFAVAESETGVDGFRFWDEPVVLPDTCPEETNVYDMRLTKHEDGYIYGVFCSESKDRTTDDLSAAVAAAGIVRTRDLKHWERLDNLTTKRSPQQRNVVLHPEFVQGKYAFYTRSMDDFIETGSGGGIGFSLCEHIEHAVIDEELMTSRRKYHTITEAKNGAGAVPMKTSRGWIHIAHGVRNTAAGLRYVIYAFATALDDPSRVIAEPSGLLLGPLGEERVGDVSNVVFTNGAIARDNGDVFIYYASSDTWMHVAVTTIDRLEDYVFHTPEDPLRSADCVKQRMTLIHQNQACLKAAHTWLRRGLVHRGCWARLKACMERAEAGETLRLGFLGGSITQGSLASDADHSYAGLVFKWWQARFPKASFTYINAGIGGTSSHYGAARVERDMLEFKPDVVVVDFSVNDGADGFFMETFEGVIRRLLTAPGAPAVVILNNVFFDDGHNAQQLHNKVGCHDDLPCISLRESVYGMIREGLWEADKLSPDNLHPNDLGHGYVVMVICHFLEQVQGSLNMAEQEKPIPKALTANGYEHSGLITSAEGCGIAEGFVTDTRVRDTVTDVFKNGWYAWETGAKLTFELTCSCLAVQYRKSAHHPVPVALAVVDDDRDHAVLLDGNFNEDWGDCLYLQSLLDHGERRTHRLELTVIKTHGDDVQPFYVTAVITV